MYEQFRNEIISSLSTLGRDELNTVLFALDGVSVRYDFSRKETGLTTPTDELPEIVKIYLVCKKMEGLSDITLSNYQRTLRLFFREVRKFPQQISPNDIRLYLYAYQKNRQVSNRTLDKYREYLCWFFTWANDEGYITQNPARNILPINFEIKPREALTQVELERLRMSCETIREKAIIEFMYSTGCRVSELVGAKSSDINWREKSVHLFGKGRKHRTSFLNAKAEVMLSEYLKTRSDDCEYIFVTERKPIRPLTVAAIQKIVRGIADRSGSGIAKDVSPHILRHTMATTALQSGMPIEEIRELLGHSSIETTMIYAKSSRADIQAKHRKYVV